MTSHDILYLSRQDLESLELTLPEIVDLLETVFREKAEGRAIMPPKHWLERGDDRFYSAMSSYLPALNAGGCKWQSGDPGNARRGLPYILGLFILNDGTTGLPVAIMDSTWITEMRTAAASGLAARYLAREGAETVAIIGCGLQGRSNLRVLHATIPSVRKAQCYDIMPETARAYSADMARTLGIEVVPMESPRAAVAGADIVITAGPILNPPRPVVEPEWLAPGALGVALDYDSYWTPGAMESMQMICSDDRGQIEHLKEYGHFLEIPRLDAELGEIVKGLKPGRTHADDRVLAFMLGIALEDLVTAHELYGRAKKRGTGTRLPL